METNKLIEVIETTTKITGWTLSDDNSYGCYKFISGGYVFEILKSHPLFATFYSEQSEIFKTPLPFNTEVYSNEINNLLNK